MHNAVPCVLGLPRQPPGLESDPSSRKMQDAKRNAAKTWKHNKQYQNRQTVTHQWLREMVQPVNHCLA